jgi:hypothetical protein
MLYLIEGIINQRKRRLERVELLTAWLNNNSHDGLIFVVIKEFLQ